MVIERRNMIRTWGWSDSTQAQTGVRGLLLSIWHRKPMTVLNPLNSSASWDSSHTHLSITRKRQGWLRSLPSAIPTRSFVLAPSTSPDASSTAAPPWTSSASLWATPGLGWPCTAKWFLFLGLFPRWPCIWVLRRSVLRPESLSPATRHQPETRPAHGVWQAWCHSGR